MKRFYYIEKLPNGDLKENYIYALSKSNAKKILAERNADIKIITPVAIDADMIDMLKSSLTAMKVDDKNIELNSLIDYIITLF